MTYFLISDTASLQLHTLI